MITYTQMIQFVAVVRNKSITKAAEELFIAQPAISSTIKKIETELNIDLFTYNNKSLQLTSSGESAYKIISEILGLYQKLENISMQNLASTSSNKKIFSFYAAPAVHDHITPHLQLLDVFPQIQFSIYYCSDLNTFFEKAKEQEHAFGIFFVPDTISLNSLMSESFTAEVITTVSTTLITSNKNSSAFAKKKSVTLKDLQNLPMIRCLGSNQAIQNYLSNIELSFCIDVADTKQINTILEKRPDLYAIGTNIFFNQSKAKVISIPVENAPAINLVLISKNNGENTDIFSRISMILRTLYAL